MTDMEAIDNRRSRRSYQNTAISDEMRIHLEAAIAKLNHISGLSIQWIENGSQAFQGIRRSYGMFRGVRSFFAMIGKTSDPHLKEKTGYYGEQLVLQATKLGLGTCWVGGTFDRKVCPCIIENDETLVCVITVGYVDELLGLKEKIIYKLAHRGTKAVEELYTSDTKEVPEWFLSGMKAVLKAPSAINAQPVRLNYKAGQVTIDVKDPAQFRLIDLGIAKAHFEIGATIFDDGKGRFELGNNAAYLLTN